MKPANSHFFSDGPPHLWQSLQPRKAISFLLTPWASKKGLPICQAYVVGVAAATVVLVSATAMAQAPAEPSHRSCEAEEGHPCCVIRISVPVPFVSDSIQELGRVFPEWEAVERGDADYLAGLTPSVILEGMVATPSNSNDNDTGPHVSFEDTPFGHDTHDFTFKVRPDDPYRYLLGIQLKTCANMAAETCPPPCSYPPEFQCGQPLSPCVVAADGVCRLAPAVASCDHFSCSDLLNMPGCVTGVSTQELIEVEWESGLGADNDDNPCHSANEAGNSCGFFSAGHRRREAIWQWPTVGDHVHVEGYWIWDRGHPPANTEIHPPRLVAIQRKLPLMLNPSTSPGAFVLATKVDVFARGDGGALNNNRSDAPSFVRRVPMSEKDYTFKITHPLPAPSPSARLHWGFVEHDGDTFPRDPNITQDTETGPDGALRLLPSVTVTIPWKGGAVPDTDVFARTFYVWWSTDDNVADLTVTHGVAADYHPRLFKVTFDYIIMNDGANDMLEPGIGQGDMELRVFVEAGGSWLFVNELVSDDVDNILEDGLGDSGDDTWDIIDRRGGGVAPWEFTLVLPPGGSFRLHADGWEADGINEAFGNLINPNANCDCQFQQEFNDLFGVETYLAGGRDDPIGEVNHIFSCQNLDSELGADHAMFFRDQSGGGTWKDDITDDTVDRDRVFKLQYHIQELSWQGASGTLPPGGACDTSPPAITITQPMATQYIHSATLTLDYSAVDVGGSGVKDLTALMDGASTLADVRQFVADGKITLDDGLSLLKPLEAAGKARSKGDCATANKIYQAFINEVLAQSGKKIDPVVAQILIVDAQYLQSHCP